MVTVWNCCPRRQFWQYAKILVFCGRDNLPLSTKSPEQLIDGPVTSEQHYCHLNFPLRGNTTPHWIRSWLSHCTFDLQFKPWLFYVIWHKVYSSRSIISKSRDQRTNMSSMLSVFGCCFPCMKSLSGINRQNNLQTFSFLNTISRSHVRKNVKWIYAGQFYLLGL